VTIRVTATIAGPEVTLSADEAEIERGRRDARLSGEQVELDVLRGAPPPGTAVRGPAAIDLPEATLVVPRGWAGEVDDSGTIQLQRER
jgi:N-methylhydantoinase A